MDSGREGVIPLDDEALERLGIYFNDINLRIDLVKEIDRLNNDIKTLLKENEAKEKVIKKQDYVINELEEYLLEYKVCMTNDERDYYEDGIKDCLDEVLDKLKELKENRDEG